MALANGKRFKSGLDDGTENPKRRASEHAVVETLEVPTIRPGERLFEFSSRVNSALPISGLSNKGAKGLPGLKAYRTRKEKKMHKMYDQWREEDRKVRERREEELELAAERQFDENPRAAGASTGFNLLHANQGPKRRSKRGKRGGKNLGGEDPWQELRKRRSESKLGPNDVALRPPDLHRLSSQKRLAIGGATVDVGSVPRSAGSLRRREQLSVEGAGVVAAYRDLRDRRRVDKGSHDAGLLALT